MSIDFMATDSRWYLQSYFYFLWVKNQHSRETFENNECAKKLKNLNWDQKVHKAYKSLKRKFCDNFKPTKMNYSCVFSVFW